MSSERSNNNNENNKNNNEKDNIKKNGKNIEQKDKSGYYSKKPKLSRLEKLPLWQQFRSGMAMFWIIVACILFYFALLRMPVLSAGVKKVVSVLKPIIYGFAIAYLLNPLVKFLDRYLAIFIEKLFPKLKSAKKISRAVGIFVSIVLMIALVISLLNMMIPELYSSIRSMITTVPAQMTNFMNWALGVVSEDTTLGKILSNVVTEVTESLQRWLVSDLMNQVNVLMSNLTVGVINVVSEILNVAIGLMVSVYVLFSKELFSCQCKKVVYAVFKPSRANMILHITTKSNEIFGGFIIGKIIDSIIIGILCFIGLTILKMPYTLLVSVIVGVTNVIPFFGPYIGAIPSAVLILLADPKKGLYFIIFILLLQQLDGNVIGPKILGDSTGLSAFWVIFSILLGGGLFGFPGMILGVPTFAVIAYIVNLVINHRLEVRMLPQDDASYDQMSYVDSDGTYVHADDNEMLNGSEENTDANSRSK